MMYLKHKHD